MANQSAEWMDYMRAACALIFVIGLIYFLGRALKKTGLNQRLAGNKGIARMKVVETLYLDPKRRLVLVRHDDDEHLLLLGLTGDVLIRSGKAGTHEA